MENKWAKKMFSTGFVLAFVNTVSAQDGPLSGISFTEDSILGSLSTVIGVEMANPSEGIATLAALGALWVSIYLVFKIVISQSESLEETLIPSEYGGADRNWLLVLSGLLTLTMVGTGMFSAILSLLGLATGLAGIIITGLLLYGLIAYAGAGATNISASARKSRASGLKTKAEAKEIKAEAQDMEADATGLIGDAKKKLQKARKEAEADHLEKGIEDMEFGLEELAKAEGAVESVLNADHEQLEDTLDDLENEMSEEANEKTVLNDMLAKHKDAEAIAESLWADNLTDVSPFAGGGPADKYPLDRLKNGGSGAGAKSVSGAASATSALPNTGRTLGGFNGIETLVNEIEQHVENEVNLAKSASLIRKEFQNLEAEAKELMEAHKLIVELKDTIDNATDEEQLFEDLAQKIQDENLYDETEVTKSELKQLEARIEQLHNEESDIKSALERALNILENEVDDLNQTEIAELDKIINVNKDLAKHLGYILANVDENGIDGGGMPELQNIINTITTQVEDIGDTLEELKMQKSREESESESLEDELRDYLSRI